MRKFFGEVREYIFSKETPEKLVQNLRKSLAEINVNIAKLNSDQLDISCAGLDVSTATTFAEYTANKNRGQAQNNEPVINIKIELKKIYETMDQYLRRNQNPQIIRIKEFNTEFKMSMVASKFGNIPTVLERLCKQIESIN